jgi:hypothetical protein
MLGSKVIVKQAPEPSEILWHNRHVSPGQALNHKIFVYFLTFVFLAGMFFLFSGMKALEVKNIWRYPAQTNCKYINDMFGDQITLYQEYASIDKSLTVDRQGTGIY